MPMPYIIFNGTDSRDVGVIIEKLPDFNRPKRNVTYTQVSGRHGRIAQDDGTYDIHTTTMKVNCAGVPLRTVYDWLRGRGWMITNNEPDRKVDVDLAPQVNDSRFRLASGPCYDTLTFSLTCQPFRYFEPDADAITITAQPYTVDNPGTMESQPKLTIAATGDVTIMVGTQRMDFEGLTDGIIVDCLLEECFDLQESSLLNGLASIEEFPVLEPGANIISWTGDVTQIQIERRCRDV